MAQYRIATPQGSAVVEAPEGATKAEVINLYNKAMTSYSTETSRGVREDTRRYMDAQLSQAQQIARSREPGIFDYIQEVPKGLIGGAANLVEQGAVGLAALLPEGAEDVVRGGIKAVGGAVQDYVEPDFNLESSVPRKLSEAVGSFVGLAGVSLFNPLAGAGLAVASGAGEASERARAAGATEDERSLAALAGIVPGALELLPISFLKVLGKDGVRSILNTTARVLSEGGVEAAQEAITGLIQNLIAQGIYKPDQKLIEGVGEQAAYGGAVGAIVQGLIELATPRTRGGASAATPAPEGIAGLITDRRPQEARETIAASLDETGEVPLAAMQDIQSRTNLPLGTLESIAQEEMDKRGSTLAQRAQTDMEAELDAAPAPETTAPVSRLSAAVEDSKQGVGAVEGRVTRDAQAAQVAAREREALRAADRGDTAAFEQPDLFARELETARRDPRGRSLQNITSPEQAVETQAPSDQLDPDAAQGDLVDLINQGEAADSEAATARQLRAESAAETAQGTIEARRTAQTTATRTKVLQDTIANAGEIRKPEALRNLYETALKGAGVANAKATPQEMESLRRASSVIRATDPALDAVAAQETIKDSKQLAMEARVAPKDRKSVPLATVITADMLPQPLKGRTDAASGTDERATPIADGRGASVEGAIQGGAATSPDGASAGQDTQKTSTPDAGRVGQPVSSTADAPAGTVAQPSALEPTPVKLKQVKAAQYDRANPNDTASYVVEGNPDISVEKLGANWAAVNIKTKERVATAPNLKELRTKLASKIAPVKADVTPTTKQVTQEATPTPGAAEATSPSVKQTTQEDGSIVRNVVPTFPERTTRTKTEGGVRFEGTPASQPKAAPKKSTFKGQDLNSEAADKARAEKQKSNTADEAHTEIFKAQPENIQSQGVADTDMEAPAAPIKAADKNKILRLMNVKRTKTKASQLANAVQRYFNQFPSFTAALDAVIYDVGMQIPTRNRSDNEYKTNTELAEFYCSDEKNNLPSMGKTSARRITDWLTSEDSNMSAELKKYVKARLQEESQARVAQENRQKTEYQKKDLDKLSPEELAARNKLAEKDAEEQGIKLELPAELVIDTPIRPAVRNALLKGDLKGALEALQFTAGSKDIALLAKKLSENVGDTKLVTKKNLKADDGAPVAGYFDPETNTISLDTEAGMNAHAVLHEMFHAVTSTTTANKAHPLTKKLTRIFEGVQEQLAGEYGLTSLDEFVAEYQTNADFANQLKTTTVNGRNPWQQLVRAVSNYIRTLLGRPTVTEDSTFDAVDKLVQEIISPNYDTRAATKIYMQIKTPAGAAKVINDLAAKTINATKGKDFYDYVQEGRSFLGGNIPPLAKKLWLNLQPVNILGELAESRIPGARQLNTIINNMSAALRKRNESLDPIVGDLKAFRRKSPDKFKTLQALVPNASAERIDPREADFDKAYGRDKSDKEQVKIAREIHKEFRKQYDSLGKEGQDLYKVITNTFEAALNDVMKSVDANLEANGVDAGMRKKALDKIAKLLDMERGVIKPFSPLTRAGTHRLKFATIDPKTDKIEVFVERYKTRGQREGAKKQLKEYNDKWLAKLPANDPRIAGIKEEWEEGTSSSVINFDNAPKGSFVYDTLRILEAEGVDKDTQHRIVDLALDSMPERSFMQSMRQRKDVRGFKGDITPTAGAGDKRFFGLLDDSFDLVDMVQTKGRDYNRQLVQMEYGAKLQKFKNEILNTIDSNKSDEITMLYRDRMELITNFAQRPNIPQWSQSLNAAGYAWTMGWNLSSAAITTFDVFMSTAPRLMGKYGDGATAKALGSAAVILRRSPKFKMVSVMGPDGKMTDRKVNTGLAGFSIGNYDFTDANLPSEVKDLEVLVGVASENAQINQSLNQEELDMNNAKDLLEKVNSWTSFLFHHAERYNREVAMTATYMLELGRMKAAKGSALTAAEKKAAAELAVRETEFTLGATASAGRPVASQKGIGNVAMLFKRFAISKYHMMATMTNDAFQAGGDAQTKENRRIAQHQLGRFLVSTGLFAGVAGMPLMGALGQIYDFFVDDDEDDFDAMLRKIIGEGLYGGIINTVLGVEVASRISLNSLLYRPPIIDKDQSQFFTLLEQLGGPVVGISLSLERGLGLINEGEILKGIEAISPAAVRNVLKGGKQFFTGEVATRRGNAVVEDIGLGQILGQLAGFANADVIRQYDINKNERRKDTYLKTTRTQLLRAANIAAAERDTDGYKDVMKRIREYNKDLPRTSRSKLIILPDTIKKSRTSFNTRTSNMIGGIEYTPQMRQSLKEYDQGIQLFD
jgi:hypothetical protein